MGIKPEDFTKDKTAAEALAIILDASKWADLPDKEGKVGFTYKHSDPASNAVGHAVHKLLQSFVSNAQYALVNHPDYRTDQQRSAASWADEGAVENFMSAIPKELQSAHDYVNETGDANSSTITVSKHTLKSMSTLISDLKAIGVNLGTAGRTASAA